MNNPHISFTTRRQYTLCGQRIAAAIKDGRCHFVDVDRGVYGSFEWNATHDDALTPELVMANYDAGNYSGMCDFALRAQLSELAEKELR